MQRGYQQGGQRAQAQGRRGAPIAQPQHPMPDANYWAQHHAASLAQDQLRRRALKPTDLDLPDGVVELSGEMAENYNRLRSHEKRLDAVMTRKMMEYQDRVMTNHKHRRRLRLQIWTEAENQPWQAKGNPTEKATYRVVIYGEVIKKPYESVMSDVDEVEMGEAGEGDGEAVEKQTQKPNPYKKIAAQEKLASAFFKSLSVEYEDEKQAPFTWNKPPMPPNTAVLPPEANFKCWRFRRESDKNLNITLRFQRDEVPERYSLSPELQWIVDEPDATRSEIITSTDEYIKHHKLQDNDDKRLIRCDKHLKAIFQRDTITFADIPTIISKSDHLRPYPELTVPFTVRVDEEYHSLSHKEKTTVVECDVWIDDPVRDYILAFTSSKVWHDHLRQILEMDEQLALVMQKLRLSVARATFFAQFADDPVGSMHRWMQSQERDLEVLLGEVFAVRSDNTLPDELRRGGPDSIWSGEKVREAVNYMLSKPEAMDVVRSQR